MSELWSLLLRAILSLDLLSFFILDLDVLKQKSLWRFFFSPFFSICGHIRIMVNPKRKAS